MFTAKIKTEQLELQGEDIFTKSFKKEALRLFVDTCLKDGMEEGLILLSKQGRLWNDQPGGKEAFQEEITGVQLPEETNEQGGRIFYGLTREVYSQNKFTYPCDDKDSLLPCVYQYPNTAIGFGNREFRVTDFQNDLRKFLIERTVDCVEEFTRKNISRNAEFETTDINLKLTLNDDLISAHVNYPLKFRVGGEEYFHLSQFDFFYPTKIKQLMESAVNFPLSRDQKYVDFVYDENSLKSDTFPHANEVSLQYAACTPGPDKNNDGQADHYICNQTTRSQTYLSLSTTMEKRELANGDDVFLFTPAERTIVDKPGMYQFRIARQNRPPALEYVNRSQCLAQNYDYLVIKDDDQLGSIDINLTAQDPDEDQISFQFVSPNGWSPTISPPERLVIDKPAVRSIPDGRYVITARATDGFLTDEQPIRVLIDRPIQSAISLNVEYQIPFDAQGNLQPYREIFAQRASVASIEDPFVITINTPSQSVGATNEEVELRYLIEGNFVNGFRLPNRHLLQGNILNYDLPSTGNPQGTATFGLVNYAGNIISFIQDQFEYPFRFFDQVTNNGEISLSYSVNYCGEQKRGDSSSLRVTVAECIPHNNSQYPFAYPYHTYQFDGQGMALANFQQIDIGIEAINPFQATHSCCLFNANEPLESSQWKIAADSKTCFVNPRDGCYGGILGFTSGKSGYILEHEERQCDGRRGNICGGNFIHTLPTSPTTNQPELRCGTNNVPDSPQCRNVATECQGQLAWGFKDQDPARLGNEGWCHGTLGCRLFCTEPVVADRDNVVIRDPSLIPFNFNDEVLRRVTSSGTPTTTDTELGVKAHCGCLQNDRTRPNQPGAVCDGNFDGIFEGRCQSDGRCA